MLYDIHERMGDSQEAIDHYTTRLDPERWPREKRAGLRVERLVSAAIAFTAARN